MAAKPRQTTPLRVTVIAESPQTIAGLRQYFEAAGVGVQATRSLDDAALITSGSSAVVLFPDEFAADQVKSRALALRRSHPDLLLVVITSVPQRLQRALQPDGHSRLPVVLAKPAFGWSILDAIRGHSLSPSP